MRHIFKDTKSVSPNRTGLKVQQLYDLLIQDTTVAWTCKEIGTALGIDITVDENLKDVSNRSGYLVDQGFFERVDKGIYRALPERGPLSQRGKRMTTTEHYPRPTAALTEPRPEGGLPPKDGPVCEECGYVARSEMGLRSHMTRTHGNTPTQDVMFQRAGQALEIMFPEGIPTSRIIELAELQKAMLKAMSKGVFK